MCEDIFELNFVKVVSWLINLCQLGELYFSYNFMIIGF